MNSHSMCDVPLIDVMGSSGDFASTWELIKQKLITPFVGLPVRTYHLEEMDQKVRVQLPDDLSKTKPGSVLKNGVRTVAVAAINEDIGELRSWAHCCFKLGLEQNVHVNLAVENHVLNMDDRHAVEVFHQVFFHNYFQAFYAANLTYRCWSRADMLAYIQNNDHSKNLWVFKVATHHQQADPRVSALNVQQHLGSVINTWANALVEASLLSNKLAVREFANHLAQVFGETCGETFAYLFNGSMQFDYVSELTLIRNIVDAMAEKLGKIWNTLSDDGDNVAAH